MRVVVLCNLTVRNPAAIQDFGTYMKGTQTYKDPDRSLGPYWVANRSDGVKTTRARRQGDIRYPWDSYAQVHPSPMVSMWYVRIVRMCARDCIEKKKKTRLVFECRFHSERNDNTSTNVLG